jgi:hypothetical protein
MKRFRKSSIFGCFDDQSNVQMVVVDLFCCSDDQTNVVIAYYLFVVLIINQTLLFIVFESC